MFSSKNIPALIYGSVINEIMEYNNILTDDLMKNYEKIKFFSKQLSKKTKNSNNYWKLKDYLNVLDVLVNTNYLYFTSNKSQIVELCQWMEDRTSIAEVNPFSGSTTVCINTTLNHSAKYTDMMLYKLS